MSVDNNKKAFDTAHTSSPVFFPDELSIVGGADHLDERERGPLDTSRPKDDPLYRPKRLETPLKLGFVASIDANGVMQAISIIKRGNVPTVEFGQCRTRAARAANYARKQACGVLGRPDRVADPICLAAGMPLRRIQCSGRKTVTTVATLGRMLAENHQRHDDDLDTTLLLMAKLLDETTNDFELVAREMGVEPQTVRSLMKYQENATPETKAMVKAGRLAISAAALICRETDPVTQNKQLAELMSAPNPTVRRAQTISRRGRGKGEPSGANPFHGKKELVKFKDFVAAEGGKSAFLEGVIAALDLQTTGKVDDERLAKIYKKFAG